MLPFVTQYQPLVSTIKEKVESSYKTNHYFAKFLKNHLLFPTRMENPGLEPAEEPPREQRSGAPNDNIVQNNIVRRILVFKR